MARKHYIAMGGSHGCLPDHCEVCFTLDGAVRDLISTYDLTNLIDHQIPRKKTGDLRKDRYKELNHRVHGADYCEIQECSCDNPLIHSDAG